MATLSTDEGERYPSYGLDMVDQGTLLARITLIATAENELRIVVERHEDDPPISLTVI